MSELKGKSGIYVIRNLVNNKAYIGSAIDLYNRKQKHFLTNGVNKSHNRYLNRSFAKHGVDNFIFEVLTYVKNKEDLLNTETLYIQLFETHNPNFGYNICSSGGNTLGYKMSDEAKQKLSEFHKGKKVSDETKQKISEFHKGKKINENTRLALLKSLKGRGMSEKTKKALLESNIGRKKSEIQKQKVKEALKDRPRSQEVKDKISKSNIGKIRSDETKQRISDSKKGTISKTKKPVIQLTIEGIFVAEYTSITEASLSVNGIVSHIIEVCKGKRNKCKGFKWTYSEDYYRED